MLLQLFKKTSARVAFLKHGKLTVIKETGHIHTFINVSQIEEDHKVLSSILQNQPACTKNFTRHLQIACGKQMRLTGNKISGVKDLFFPKTSRPKRQLAAGLGIFSVGLSIFEETQILQLQADVAQQMRINEEIYKSVNQEKHAINVNSNNIRKLNETMSGLLVVTNNIVNQIEEDEMMDKTSRAVDHHEHAIDNWRDGLIQIARGEMPIDLIKASEMQNLLESLKVRAYKRGGILAIGSAKDILRLPISHATREDGIDVFIHVEVFEEPKFELYEHIELPIIHGQYQYQVIHEKKYLISDKFKQNSIEVSADFLTKCQSFQKLTVCPPPRVFVPTSQTCLGCLLLDSPCIENFCEISVHIKHLSSVVHLQNELFALHFFEKTNVTKKCGEQEFPLHFEIGTKIVRLENGCSIYGSNLLITERPSKFSIDQPHFYFTPHTLPLYELIDSSQHEVIDNLKTSLGGIENPPKINLNELKKSIEAQKQMHQNWKVIVGIVVVGVLLFFILVIILTHLCFKHFHG